MVRYFVTTHNMSPRNTPALSLRLFPLLLLLGAGQRCLAARPLLVFLIDGFRYDYMDDLQALPGFRELVSNGVKVDYMTPDFPSLSYPNYYSLMTGRHCDVHQMTGNYMWDEASKKEFLIGTNPDSRLPLWWDGSEPIWVTLQKLGKKVFMYYWPGCDVEILNVRPSFCEECVYNPSEKNFTDSIENALNVMRSGQAGMAAIYYEKIDVEGHHFGPDSPQLRAAVHQLDLAFQTLNSKIKEKKMVNQLNIMLFSDHGMTKIQWMEKVIELDKYINMSAIAKMMDRGPVVSLWPKDKKYQENKARLPYWKNDSGEPSAWQNGWHGYDNEFLDMRGFFLASGPDFKRNVRAAPIRVVDVYNVMCWTLGVKPLPNNGSWSRVEYFLNDSDGPSQPTTLCFMGLLGILLALWN
ncbi:glycerophosphocholine cholinephosphodiesterase ENPP6 isoform X2 [Cottoperca gobio]|uniref:glycerophosphocholine cholinephosphodiesterase n=1 Tax=Cottoperca gobio TaxID=56716 RepID=A0A6J2QL37_COTGO|nr:ectonucleotide pyrophosphatase/phosphodiesterase family member 6 isoform X2 [Cottoperca gobio]